LGNPKAKALPVGMAKASMQRLGQNVQANPCKDQGSLDMPELAKSCDQASAGASGHQQ
jgi:hypothetical protein